MMTTDRLKAHYGVFGPQERLSLITAAVSRGDEQEAGRLRASAPRVVFDAPDTYTRSRAFRAVADDHRHRMLELAGFYLLAGSSAFALDASTDRERGEELADCSRVYAYLLRTQAAGWVRFCDTQKLPPTYFDKVQAGGGLLALAETHLANTAVLPPATETEAREILARRSTGNPADMQTVGTVYADLIGAFEALLKHGI